MVGAIGAAGLAGTSLVPLIAEPALLGTGLTFAEQVRIHLLGLVAISAWCLGVGGVLIYAINRFFPLRCSAEDERVGLNISEHGASNSLLKLANAMSRQRHSGDFRPVSVEPFTEVGQIAGEYNRVIFQVITERERNRKMAQRAEAQRQLAEQARSQTDEANSANSVFLANMSHELRTPLNGILGKLAVIDDNELTADATESIQLAQASGEHLLAVLGDLLDARKIEAGNLQLEEVATNVHALLSRVNATVGELAATKGTVCGLLLPMRYPNT